MLSPISYLALGNGGLRFRLIAISRSKTERDDIYALCQQIKIQAQEQAQQLVDRYIPNKQVQQIYDLDDTLNFFFP